MLDDYLDGGLAGDETARFAEHLVDCHDCRAAVRGHERLSAVLTEAIVEFNSAPAGLTDQIRRRLRVARRRRLVAGAAALAASVAAVWFVVRGNPRPVEPGPEVADVRPLPELPTHAVRVTFPAGAKVLVVPVPSDSPNVTIIWVYPDLRRTAGPAEEGPSSSPQGRNS